ncbi:MAG TPA: hypothetical protein VFS62_03315, partial [Chloroflexota bacterium]|nr:hypothetical protein [Chloroflexota bacterium]
MSAPSRRLGTALGVVLLANALATQISSIVGLSGFLSDIGVSQLLIVWLIDDVSILAVSAGQAFLVDRFNRLTLMRWVALTFGLALVAIRLLGLTGLPGWLTYALLYGVSEQQFLFFPLIFWVLAEDGLQHRERERLFPVIGSYGLVGKLLGIALSGVAPVVLHAAGADVLDVLYVDAGMYVLAWAVVEFRLRDLPIRGRFVAPATAVAVLTEGFAFVKSVPAFRYIAFSSV